MEYSTSSYKIYHKLRLNINFLKKLTTLSFMTSCVLVIEFCRYPITTAFVAYVLNDSILSKLLSNKEQETLWRNI
jgi:hypothetical protein